MKKHINLFKNLLLAFLFVLPAISQAAGTDDGIEKKKTISKSYTVTAMDKLQINNQFGDVAINTWDKNEIKVDIEIYSKAETEERAQKIIDKINVTDARSGNTISFETKIGSITGNSKGTGKSDNEDDKEDKNSHYHKGYNNQQFHINYIVFMPTNNPLEVENKFGKLSVPDFKGLVNLTSKFGSLETGNLENVDDIDVQFGQAKIGNVNNGKIVLKFDDKSTVGKLSGTVKITNEFSELVQYFLSNAIDELTINNSYSSIRLIVEKDISATFSIHTNFGDFLNNTDFKINEKIENADDDSGIHFDKDFTGTAGDGKAKIKIKNSFGKVKLSHTAASKEEINEEKMERKERKERKEKKEKKEPKEVEES